ncbi:MAG: hypothetical protein Q7Q71_07810, partial [Verrucomicrobiota bacterium JB023]|nr:hypothetical protein [Verrucomicrobiota bacterium JB023]
DANDAAKVRQVWSKWMAQEAKLAEMKGNESETGGRSAAYDKFVLDRRPQLLWELEKTIFTMGEQQAAALKMLDHLQEYEGHADEVKWTNEFKALLELRTEG